MFQISDQTIEGEEIILPDDGRKVYLGHNVTLVSCRIRFTSKGSENAILAKCRFLSCHIFANRPVKKTAWDACQVTECTFHGRFMENTFGDFMERRAFDDFQGSIHRCDFTDADMHACRFFGCDMREMRLPRWPCFTLIDPRKTFDEITALHDVPAWLEYWNDIDGEISRKPRYSVTATTDNASRLVQWLRKHGKVEVTEDDVYRFLKDRENVVM